MAGNKRTKAIKRKYSEEKKTEILNALHTTCNGNMALASRLHNVPKTTLFDWVHAEARSIPMAVGTGHSTMLPEWVERDLCDVLCVMSGAAVPLSRSDIQDLTQSVVKDLKLKTRFKDGRPGSRWALYFEARWRHRFTRRGREGLSYNRATGLTKHKTDVFYDMLEALQNEHNFAPEDTWNGDETGFMGSKVTQKVYTAKELKNAYSLEGNPTKSLYSVLFCANAAGTWLPPFTVYKAANLWYEWTTGGYPGAMYGCSRSGWMEGHNFEAWFCTKFIELTKTDKPRLFLFDGHNSHISYSGKMCI